MKPSIQQLVDDLRLLPPNRRIEFREPILAFGSEAVRPLATLVAEDDDLGPSVASWLAVLADRDPSTRAAVLRALRQMAKREGSASAPIARGVLDRMQAPTRSSR